MRPDIANLNRLVAALLTEPVPAPERAAQLLTIHGGAGTLALLIDMLSAHRPGARHLAARALGALGNSQAIPELAILLVDPDEGVRAAARRAIERLDAPPEAGLLDLQQSAQPRIPSEPTQSAYASSEGAVTTRLEWAPGELEPVAPRRRTWRRALVVAVLVAGLGLAGLLAPQLDLPGRASELFTAPEAPGIGTPVRDSSWEVVLNRVHEEARLPSMSDSYTPHDGYIFLVADLKIHSLAADGAPPRFSPNTVSLAIADNSAIYTPELLGLPMGESMNYTSPLGLLSYSVGGESVYKDGLFSTPKDGLEMSFVFVVKPADRTRKFQLRFASVPAISFVVGAPASATDTPTS